MLNSNDIQEATMIDVKALENTAMQVSEFLVGGASLVGETEPNTKLWFALQGAAGEFSIFDVFPDNNGRDEHFAGQVAGALNANADALLEGGWDNGVVPNIKNFSVLSSKIPTSKFEATLATYIEIQSAPGKSAELKNLLTSAAEVITQTEPGTVFWAALQLNENTFGIFDTFVDEDARAAHFSGKVADALKGQSEEIVAGGWDEGVVSNVRHFTIVAETKR